MWHGAYGVAMPTCKVCSTTYTRTEEWRSRNHCGPACQKVARKTSKKKWEDANQDKLRGMKREYARERRRKVRAVSECIYAAAYKVVQDPDNEFGLLPGKQLSVMEVKYGREIGTFTPGTILAHGQERIMIVGETGEPQKEVKL